MSYAEIQMRQLKEALERVESQEDSALINQAMHDALEFYWYLGDAEAMAAIAMCITWE